MSTWPPVTHQDVQDAVTARAVIADVGTSGTATGDALKAAFGAQEVTRPAFFPGGSTRIVGVEETPDFFVKMINLGIGPNTIDTTISWGSGWDWAGFVKPKMDRIANVGANAVRIQGNFHAWNADRTGYQAKFSQLMEYARSLNLRVNYVLMNYVDDFITPGDMTSANRSTYAAMATALVGPYTADPMILGWDLCNEAQTGATDVTILTNFATDVRTVDPAAKLTISIPGMPVLDRVTTWESVVDFHDVHLYSDPMVDSFHPNWLDDIRALTVKPLLIGEFGANLNAGAAGGPHTPDIWQQAQYINAMRRYAFTGDLMGLGLWQIQDDSSDSEFGLYDASGNPRPAVGEWMKYPTRRQDAAVDAVRYRLSPVVLDTFARADNVSAIGNPPIGPAPTAALGTWGINARTAVVNTGDASGHNIAVWESHAADGTVQFTSRVPFTTVNVGLVFRFTDSSNYHLYRYSSLAGTLDHYQCAGGAFTLQGQKTIAVPKVVLRLAVTMRQDKLYFYLFDRLIWQETAQAFNDTATQHGIYRWTDGSSGDTDDGSYFCDFSVKVPLLLY